MVTVGVDLGKRKSQYAVISEQGEILVERSLPNTREAVRSFLRSLPGPLEVGCETCTNTYWLVEVVESLEIPITVGHAQDIRLIAHAKIKTDKIDGRVIAELLRCRYFPAIVIPPKAVRDARELLRGRAKLRRTEAQQKNRLHGVLTRAGIDYRAKDLTGPGTEAWLESVGLEPGAAFLAKTYCHTMGDVQQRIRELDAEIRRQVRPTEPWASIAKRLQTMPGIGEYSALLIVLELWDIDRFPDTKHLASYVGLVPSVHQSGQTLRYGSLTKRGNRYLRWILVQDAWTAIRTCWRYRGMHEHYAAKQGRTRAIIPIARQLLADAYEIWRQGIAYKDLIEQKRKNRKSA
jgi:transposase